MSATVKNTEISNILFQVSELLEIENVNPFRVKAYRNAAIDIKNQSASLAQRVLSGEDISKLPGIGAEIAASITEIVRTGELSMLDELEHTMPPSLIALSHVPNIGPKRVKIIETYLPFLSQETIIAAAKDKQLSKLPTIGVQIERAILDYFESAPEY